MPRLPAASSAIDRRRFLGVTAGTAAASTLLNSTTARAETHHPPPSRFRRRRVRFGMNWTGWTQVIQRYGALSTSSTHYSEFFIELIKTFHTDLKRKVWIEETGVSMVWMDAADIPTWTERSIRAMTSCTELFGVTWWDSHDLNPKPSGYVDPAVASMRPR